MLLSNSNLAKTKISVRMVLHDTTLWGALVLFLNQIKAHIGRIITGRTLCH